MQPLRFSQTGIPAGLLLLSLVVQLSGTTGIEWLQYRRDLILDGQVWRLVTGHLVHGTWNHWMLNAGGLALLWALCPRQFAHASSLWLMAAIMLATGAALLLLNPGVVWYVGMSALLHGLLVAWLVVALLNGRHGALLLLLLIAAKLVYEQVTGPLPGTAEATGLPVLVDAHLYAAIAGGVLGVVTPAEAGTDR